MNIIEQALFWGGFLLAHSADNLSYIDEVKVLTPFSICFKAGEIHTQFHTGRTQAEAIAKAKDDLGANSAQCEAWAFAREGRLDENGKHLATLSVSAWATGMKTPIDIIQRFERSPRFRLIEEPWLALDGKILDSTESPPLLTVLRHGISRHEDGGPKWDSWH